MNTTAVAPQTIHGEGMYIFRELEINPRMDVRAKVEEMELYRYIRRKLNNHVLKSGEDFDRIIQELKSRVDVINLQRMGTGSYLQIDGVLPTDHAIGWIKLSYTDNPLASSYIIIVSNKGDACVH